MKRGFFTLLVTLVTMLSMGLVVAESTAYGHAGEGTAQRLYYRDGSATLAIGHTSRGYIQADVLFPETDTNYIQSMKMKYPSMSRVYVRIRGQLIGTDNNAIELYHVDRLVMKGNIVLDERREIFPEDAEYGVPLARIVYKETGSILRLRLERMPKVDKDVRRILRHMTDGKYKNEESPDFTFTEQAILDYIFSERGRALG
ncbi:hypothetical protein TAMA11512_16800 [Selenomonas sp. TAMA-11512]|uniref:hypothetical protein n=1 Tax=Selenomonas sp. TAMA-11512 TaxID=3095337 RepID=UPI00308E3602|nr:hypothetical protein TAMA11512_16800 [Selenomonas sp. TAMA-11512]